LANKKICFIVSSPSTVKAFLVNHIKALALYYEVYLVANFENENENENIFKELPLNGIKDIRIPRDIKLLQDLKALLALRLYFKAMQFDAVHTVTPKAGLLGVTAARLGGVKKRFHIFTGQVWHTKKGIFKSFLMFLDRIIVKNATHILVDGESQRQFLIQNKVVGPNNSFVLGKGSISGVDLDRFVSNPEMKEVVRKELGFNHNDVVYMFLGRMNTDKGVIELAEAFNNLRNNYPNVRLLLVGVDEENLSTMIRHKITHNNAAVLYGATSTPEKLLQACDIFCLPSHREGFGTSVIEASLLAKPVICSDTYGLMETIIDNKTGLRHKVGDTISLYVQMEKLVNDSQLRDSLGMAGRKYVHENFSARTISEKWLEFYKHNV
jgi:glycosyltransferase involved in cell wall biosynthesis